MASILFIYNEIPDQTINGGAIRVFNLLKGLSRYHDISLLTLAASRRNKNTNHLQFCREIVLAPRFIEEYRRLTFVDFIQYIAANVSYLVQRYFFWQPKIMRDHYLQVWCLRRELKKIIKKKSFDYIQVENAYLGNVLSGIKGDFKKIIDFHDVYDAAQIFASIYDIALSCSEGDRQALAKMGYKNTLLVPNGVDLNEAKNLPVPTVPKSLLFIGDLLHSPNKEGIKYFLKHVYPQLSTKLPLHIIGRYNRSDFKQEIKIPGVHFHGFLPTIDFYFEYAIFVCPILEGGGTRIKILTAFLKGAPVVSTKQGARGIKCTNGKDIMIADSPKQFAGAIDLLFVDVKRYNRIRNAAFELVERNYGWQKIISNYAKNI